MSGYYIVEPRFLSILLYENGGDVNYSASCQVFRYGDRGMMFNINGKLFYKILARDTGDILDKLGVKTLEGYVTDAHKRLMSIALRDKCDISDRGRGDIAGHDMVWVVIKMKDKG